MCNSPVVRWRTADRESPIQTGHAIFVFFFVCVCVCAFLFSFLFSGLFDNMAKNKGINMGTICLIL